MADYNPKLAMLFCIPKESGWEYIKQESNRNFISDFIFFGCCRLCTCKGTFKYW